MKDWSAEAEDLTNAGALAAIIAVDEELMQLLSAQATIARARSLESPGTSDFKNKLRGIANRKLADALTAIGNDVETHQERIISQISKIIPERKLP